MGKVCVILCFFVYKLCMPGFPAVLAWLHWQGQNKCVHKSTCYCFFTKTKQSLHATFPMICHNPWATTMFKPRSHQLLPVWMANTGTSPVDGDTEQLFWASGPRTVHRMCSYACAKGFQLWTLTFKKCKGGIETKIKFICHVEKTKLGNPLNN